MKPGETNPNDYTAEEMAEIEKARNAAWADWQAQVDAAFEALPDYDAHIIARDKAAKAARTIRVVVAWDDGEVVDSYDDIEPGPGARPELAAWLEEMLDKVGGVK